MKQYTLGLYEKAMPDLSFEEKLDITARCGFDRMEISIDESDAKQARLNWTDAQKYALAQAQQNAGVPITTMCLSGHRKYPIGSHDPKVREQGLEVMRKALEFSAATGVRLIQLAGYDVYYEESDESTRAWFAENLARCTEMAAVYGINMGFETMETPFMNTTEKAMHYVSLINSSYLGVYPDIGNLKNAAVTYGTDVVEDLKTGKGHLFAAHLKETNPGIFRDMKFGSGGHTEYERCISELWGQGVRVYTGEFWYKGAENWEQEIREASEFLRGKIAAGAGI